LGNLITGTNIGSRTYAIDVPLVTNAPFDIVLRSDASAGGCDLKLDGGIDLNSHLGLGPTNGLDRRDHPPGSATDTVLGYEGTQLLRRVGPEKFGAVETNRNTLTSFRAETYHYVVGGGATNIAGGGGGLGVDSQTATWVWHDPDSGVTAAGGPATQRSPLSPGPGQAVDVWFRAGFQFQEPRIAPVFRPASWPDRRVGVTRVRKNLPVLSTACGNAERRVPRVGCAHFLARSGHKLD
jgi:hypothetical protein